MLVSLKFSAFYHLPALLILLLLSNMYEALRLICNTFTVVLEVALIIKYNWHILIFGQFG